MLCQWVHEAICSLSSLTKGARTMVNTFPPLHSLPEMAENNIQTKTSTTREHEVQHTSISFWSRSWSTADVAELLWHTALAGTRLASPATNLISSCGAAYQGWEACNQNVVNSLSTGWAMLLFSNLLFLEVVRAQFLSLAYSQMPAGAEGVTRNKDFLLPSCQLCDI